LEWNGGGRETARYSNTTQKCTVVKLHSCSDTRKKNAKQGKTKKKSREREKKVRKT
jgi:hypothetical protein